MIEREDVRQSGTKEPDFRKSTQRVYRMLDLASRLKVWVLT